MSTEQLSDYSLPFHESIYRKRKELRWTQEEVARRSGLSLQGYRKIEAGISQLQLSTLYAICGALNIGITFTW
jgi:transcriptional regulator with XRE-family HTH domain